MYQGEIPPLSCRSLIETCVVPILLCGCENWSLCDSSLKILNSFLGKLCKRITVSMIVVDCLSGQVRCLTRRLCFLRWIIDHSSANHADTLSSRLLFALSDDIESVCLIRECLGLEEQLDIKFTCLLLISNSGSNKKCGPSLRQIRDQIDTNFFYLKNYIVTKRTRD